MKLASYDPFTIPMPKKEVDEAQLAAKVNEIVSRIPYYADSATEAVGADDRVKVRLTMAENDTPLKGLDEAELTLTVGDGFFPEPFYQGIIGMKLDEFREFSWQEDDGVRNMSAAVRVLSLRKREKPPMDDAWVAAHIPRCSTLEEFFESVRGQLQEETDKSWRELLSERCKVALAQRLETPPSAEDIERAVQGVQANFKRQMAAEGKIKSQIAAEQGIDESQLDAVLTQQGVMIAAQSVALKAVADHFDLQVTSQDIETSLNANFSQDDPARRRFETDEGKADIEEIALQEKALAYALEHLVQIVEERPGQSFGSPARPYPNPFQ